MSDLFGKLNVLLRASLSNVANGKLSIPANGTNFSPQEVESQISQLRQQVNIALDNEDAMQRRLDEANTRSADLDKQVDDALMAGDDTNARSLSAQLQRQQQQTAMLAADLENHRRSTANLLEQVNQLEALVSEAKMRQSSDELVPPEALLADETTTPLSTTATSVRVPVNIGVPRATDTAPASESSSAIPTENDTDLAQRRSRLSMPDPPEESQGKSDR